MSDDPVPSSILAVLPEIPVAGESESHAQEIDRLRLENETLKRRLQEVSSGMLSDQNAQRAALNLLEDRVAAHASAGRVNAERQRAERELAAELDATGLLQRLGSRFIREEGNDNFHEQIVDTAMTLMGADCGSMQLLEPRTNTLRLLAWKGFHSESAKYWETVTLETGTTCGLALKLGERLVIPDLEEESRVGAETMGHFRRSGIRAVQSTPLVSRRGELLGMISTHWAVPHEPNERDLRFMDLLARQAADLLERQRQEAALRESEERFRTLTEAAPALIWFDDPQGHCRFVNQDYLSFTGKTGQQLEGDGWRIILHEEDSPAYLADLAEATRDRRPFHHVVRVRRHDGEWRWLESFARPHFGADGTYLGHVGISPDITERRSNEERHAFLLKLSDALRPLSDALEIKRAAMRVIGETLGVDRVLYGEVMSDGKVMVPDNYVRGDYPKMTGSFHADDFGAADIDRLRAGEVLLIPDVEKATGLVPAAKATYQAFNIRTSLTVPLIKGGRWVSNLALHQGETREWTRHEIDMLQEAAERTWAAAGRARAEEDLRASEEKYRTLFDSMDEGYCIIQMIYDEAGTAVDWRFLEVNPAFELHNGLRNAVGKTILELAPGLEPKWMEIYNRVAVTGESLRIEEDSAAFGRTFDLYAFRVGEPGERKVAVLFNDITERKRSERALHDANLRKDEFLAMLAHELRNPLAAIHSAGQLLLREDSDTQCRHKAVEILNRQTDYMVRQVDDLLDVGRISSGKIELRKKLTEIGAVVNHAVEAVQPLCQNKGHELAVTLPPLPLHVHGDPARLAQVVGNLLTNACKFTANGGKISLTVEQVADEAVIRVSDNGIGIAPADISRIFEIFAQADRGIETTCEGLGLGLTLVKKLVELHGGTVEARSEGLGHGSQFVVRLPLAGSPAARSSEPAGKISKEAAAKSLRVLVVDDNRDVAGSMAMVLELIGHRVEMVHDGSSAIEKASAWQPDVILLDIGMPGMNGYEVARQIRRQGQEGLRIVAVTGWGQADDRQLSKEAGFDAHLVKPVNIDMLMRVFAEVK